MRNFFYHFLTAGLVLAYLSTSCHVTKTSIMAEEPNPGVSATIQPVLPPFDRRGNVKILLKNVFKMCTSTRDSDFAMMQQKKD